MKNNTRTSQEFIFRNLFEKYKGTPMANSSESYVHKTQRYELVSGIFRDETNISLHDVGMGTGEFGKYLKQKFPDKNINYSGSEIINELIAEAEVYFPSSKFYCRDLAERSYKDRYDYIILSGVFHQKRDASIKEWENFYKLILKNSFLMCRKGISFNFITPFVDYYQTDVYYCNLSKLLNFINDDLSRFFEIKHNYALYEFTVYVYKEEYIRSITTEIEFHKYFKK